MNGLGRKESLTGDETSTGHLAGIATADRFVSMRVRCVTLAFVTGLVACHSQQPSPVDSATRATQRSVFTDSSLHAQLCEPNRPGENWRDVCVPKDQGVRLPQPKTP